MKILARYLSREILVATAFVLFSLVALFAFFDLIGQMGEVGNRYKLSHAFMLTALTLPVRVYEVMPIAALIGAVYALSRLAASSEFTIMRVSGMSALLLARSLAVAGVALVVATYLFGEFVAPPADRYAQKIKLLATQSEFTGGSMRSGVWARDVVRAPDGAIESLRFINVRSIGADRESSDWRVFDFDGQYRLRSLLTAARGEFVPGKGWQLSDVVETRIPAVDPEATGTLTERTTVRREGQMLWGSEVSPEIFGVLMVKPENMAIHDLDRYIRHLSENRQQTDRYEIAFWGKVFYPLAILVMLALAMPFAYLNVRSGGVSIRIFAGVMIGIGFYGLNNLFSYLGLLNTWPPIAVAVLPSGVMLLIAAAALWWVERR